MQVGISCTARSPRALRCGWALASLLRYPSELPSLISKRPVLLGTFLSEAYPVKTTRLASLDSGSSPPVLETETKASEKPHKTHTQDLAVGGGFLLAQVRGDSPLHHAVSHWGSNCCPVRDRRVPTWHLSFLTPSMEVPSNTPNTSHSMIQRRKNLFLAKLVNRSNEDDDDDDADDDDDDDYDDDDDDDG